MRMRNVLSLFPELPRSEMLELLDGQVADIGALADNLHDLRVIDRLLGGTRLVWRALQPLLAELPQPVTLLDVATGGADGPQQLARLARRAGYELRPIASDRLIEVLRLARVFGAEMPLIRHDALAIPLQDSSVDFVTCTLALHHFAPEDAIRVLRELARVARRGVIVADLRRMWLAYAGARLLASGPWRAMARHDGPLSVLRAYTLPEIHTLIHDAGLDATVDPAFPFWVVVRLREF